MIHDPSKGSIEVPVDAIAPAPDQPRSPLAPAERLIPQREVVRAFEHLPAAPQPRLLAAARREGRPITQRRLQEALAEPGEERSREEPAPPPERGRPAAPVRPAAPSAVSPSRRQARAAGTDLLVVPLTFTQVKDLLRFLGARPHTTPAAAIDQLVKLVGGMAGCP